MRDEWIKKSQIEYYGGLYKKHGYSPEAVASGKQIYKDLRYRKLSRLFGQDRSFSLHDVGMGLGHYFEFLRAHYDRRAIDYSGTEVVEDFYTYCREKYPDKKFYLRDLSLQAGPDTYDYLVLGGVFYHPCGISRRDWEKYLFRMIRNVFPMAKKGIAFNLITEFCDFYEKDLYYCHVSKLLAFLADDVSRFFLVDHTYPLYELTVYVYKEEVVRGDYPEQEYDKYFRSNFA